MDGGEPTGSASNFPSNIRSGLKRYPWHNLRTHASGEEKERGKNTHIISPDLRVTLNLGNIDCDGIFWGDGVLSIADRGGFRRGHGSSRSGRV